jgi:FkbM family methyltransferase
VMPRRLIRAWRGVAGPTRSLIHQAAATAGLDLVRYRSVRHSVGRRILLIHSLGIDLVFDVGANRGQFGMELRRHGYRGRIVSFEPLGEPFAGLRRHAENDPLWDVVRVALGNESGTREMHVTANIVSSSLRDSLPRLRTIEPRAAVERTERVDIRRLDDLADRYLNERSRPYMKVDVQGFESEVLAGAGMTIPRIVALQLELSLAPSYLGSMLAGEVVVELERMGFILAGLEPGLADPRTGALLEADGIFVAVPELARLVSDADETR